MHARWVIAALVLGMTACSATVRVSREEVQANLAKRFPKEVDKHVVVLRASDPRVEFPGRPDILAVRMRIEATSVSGNSRLAGTARVEGRIEYVEAQKAFYLREPRVTELDLAPEGDGKLAIAVTEVRGAIGDKLLERAARWAAAELLKRHPVYRLDPNKKKDAKAIRHLKRVHVEGQELVLEVAL